MTSRCTLIALLALLGLASVAAAQDVVFVVRHAERADDGMKKGTEDPPLSTAGEARAQALARMLRSADVEHIFATEFKRTQQTAQPLAAVQHVELTIVTAKAVKALVEKLSSTKGTSLVVGHSDTVPEILHALGVKQDVNIGGREYDNLFVVVTTGGEPKLIKLRY